MTVRFRDSARRARDTLKRGPGRGKVDKRITRLRRRVDQLEEEVQECRRLNRRVAELLDLVEELLLPVAQRDEDKIAEYLERYQATL